MAGQIWNSILSEATSDWQRWSVLSPLERGIMDKQHFLSYNGLLKPSNNVVEAQLRVELCERFPSHIIKKCMADNRVTAVDSGRDTSNDNEGVFACLPYSEGESA
eukprot:6476917-Amphidinium_carterae.2